MTYEMSGFDPTVEQNNADLPFNTWHATINGVDLHIIDAPEIFRRIDADPDELITLVDATDFNPHGNIKHVKATISSSQTRTEQPATSYDALVTLHEKGLQNNCMQSIGAADYTRLEQEVLYGTSVRLLRSPRSLLIQAVVAHPQGIQLTNKFLGTSDDSQLTYVGLSAPAKVDVKHPDQLSHSLDCLTAVMNTVQNLGRHSLRVPPCSPLIITPDGPLYKNPDTSEYVHRLSRETITTTRAVETAQEHPGFDQLFGIEDIRSELQPIALFYKRPDLVEKWHIHRPGNVILFGPPGTGKTAIAYALQKEIGADMYEISPADVYNELMGGSEKAIKAIFDEVRSAKEPTVLLFDEMESIVNVVDGTSSAAHAVNNVAGIFKTESARVTAENPNVIIVATTNNLEKLDPALIRSGRFDMRIAVGLPNEEARRQMYGNLILNHHNLDVDGLTDATAGRATKFNPFSTELLNPESLAKLVKLTAHDFSPADIVESLRRAKLVKAADETRTGEEQPPIDTDFLANVIHKMRQNRIL